MLGNFSGGSGCSRQQDADRFGGLYRWDMGPAQGGPQAHFHRTFSESFFVVSGTVQLFDGNTWLDGQPGDFVYVPEGGLHGFRNESGEPELQAFFEEHDNIYV